MDGGGRGAESKRTETGEEAERSVPGVAAAEEPEDRRWVVLRRWLPRSARAQADATASGGASKPERRARPAHSEQARAASGGRPTLPM